MAAAAGQSLARATDAFLGSRRGEAELTALREALAEYRRALAQTPGPTST
jgi:hypothetical protein